MRVKLEEKDFERLLSYCLHHKNSGRMKYFYEISIPDSEYKSFLDWLEKCEDASLTYIFTVIKRYEGHKLLYGFTNFEVVEDFTFNCFDFCFENDDILIKKFREWKYESEYGELDITINLSKPEKDPKRLQMSLIILNR